ncbi:hypothetical protein NLI96_g6978 [Meripilus lineatus]|uniref:RCC1/BLIP-II protein n=1 Tax=Meripilus lineatus TaxID=2056292 RepID=A0AAD5V1Q1_9APHY|nr:hypothetical protein NLI96_g6978 [Physisporinus lineatus]
MSGKRILVAGSNGGGQLATGTLDDAHEFIPCSFVEQPPGILPPHTKEIVQIACGSNHTLLLLRLDNGVTQLYGSGDGRRGQLGPGYFGTSDSSNARRSVFRLLHPGLAIPNIDVQDYHVRLIAAGWETSYVVLSCSERDDILLSFGSNDFGNLGVGSSRGQTTEVHVVDLRAVVDGSNGTVGLIQVDSLVASTHHVVVQVSINILGSKQKTFILGWGASRHGQLGAEAPPSRPPQSTPSPRIILPYHNAPVISIAAGFHHTVFLHVDGVVSALGSDRKLQLQRLDQLNCVTSVACTWHGTYAVEEKSGEWSVYATGSNNKGQLGHDPSQSRSQEKLTSGTPPSVSFPFSSEGRRLIKLVCGSEHVLCLFAISSGNGSPPRTEVWGWGWNEHGNLGTGDTADAHFPSRVWPPTDANQEWVRDIWAGCGTSWLILERS